MKKMFYAAAAISLFVGPLTASAQPKKHHVVVALTSPDQRDWTLTIGNLRHLLEDLRSESPEIEVVAYGPGVSFVRINSSAAPEVEGLEKQNVRFLACENSMKHMGITAADLIPGVKTVPSGIGEVVKREEQGWVYIKAGQ